MQGKRAASYETVLWSLCFIFARWKTKFLDDSQIVCLILSISQHTAFYWEYFMMDDANYCHIFDKCFTEWLSVVLNHSKIGINIWIPDKLVSDYLTSPTMKSLQLTVVLSPSWIYWPWLCSNINKVGPDNDTVQFNTMRLRKYGHHFADSMFNCIFWNENHCILNKTWFRCSDTYICLLTLMS